MRVNLKTDRIAATAVSIFRGLLRRTAAGRAGGSAAIVAGILYLHAPAVYGQQTYTYTLSMVTATDSSTNCVGTASGQSSSATVNVSFSGNCTDGFSARVTGSIQFPPSITLGSDAPFSVTATATMSGVLNIPDSDPYIVIEAGSNANYLAGPEINDDANCSSNGMRGPTTSTAIVSCVITSTNPNQNPGAGPPPDRIAIQVGIGPTYTINQYDSIATAYTAIYTQQTSPPPTCPTTPTASVRAVRAATTPCVATLTLSRAVASNASDNGSPILPASGAPAPEPLQIVISGPNLPLSGTVDVGDIKLASAPDFKSAPQATNSSEIDLALNGFTGLKEGIRTFTVKDASGTAVGQANFFVSALVTQQLEINQAVPMNCTAQACVAEHNTVVRARIFCNDPSASCNGLSGLKARLHVNRNGVPVGVADLGDGSYSPFLSDPAAPPLQVLPVGKSADVLTQRDGSDTLNFFFTEALNNELPEGTYDFYLTINPLAPTSLPNLGGTPADPLNLANNLVTGLPAQPFVKSRKLTINFLLDRGFRTRAPGIAGQIKSSFDVLKAVFPVSRSRFSATYRRSDISFDNPGASNDDELLDATWSKLYLWYQDYLTNTTGDGGLVFFFTQATDFESPGASKCSAPLGSYGCDFQMPFSVVNWQVNYGDTRRSSIAHEMGHHYLLGDTYTEGATASPNNPITYSNPASQSTVTCSSMVQQIGSDSTGGCPSETGNFDSILNNGPGTDTTRGANQRQFLQFRAEVLLSKNDDPTSEYQVLTKRDLMGNAPRSIRWTDIRSWNWLYPMFMPTPSASPNLFPAPKPRAAGAPAQYLFVSGEIGRDDTMTFAPCHPTTVSLPPSDVASDYSVSVLDAAGNVLSSASFPVWFIWGHLTQPLNQTSFSAYVPYPPGAAQIVVKHLTKQIGALKISPNPPTVQLISPNGGENLDGVVTVSWAGADVDGGALTYDLLASADNGATWEPIAVTLTGGSYAWDTTQFSGTTQALLKVVANDGVNEATAISAGVFSIAYKGPIVSIDAPSDGAVLANNPPFLFQGSSLDLQDDELPDSSLVFTSDRDGVLGKGPAIRINQLSTGLHTITLTGTNSQGLTGTASIQVTVLPPSAPVINAINPAMASAGTVVAISGANFSATPTQNVVLFGTVQAQVSSSTTTQINAVVPGGLPDGPVSLTVAVAGFTSNTFYFSVTAPRILLSSTSLSFGSVPVNQTQNLSLIVQNTGDVNLIVSSLSSLSPFSVVSPATPFTVSAGKSATVTVRFSPAAAGSQSGSLVIASNDPVNPRLSVPLTGTGGSATGGSCTFTLSSTSASVPAVSSGTTVPVTASAFSCSWNAVSNVDWIVIVTGPNYTGSQTISYTVAPNPTTSQRTGTLTIAGQTYTVTQAAGTTNQPPLTSVEIRNDGGTFTKSAGPPTGSTAWYVVRITPPAYPATLKSIEIYFGNRGDGLAAGAPITLVGTNSVGGGIVNGLNFYTIPNVVNSLGTFNTYPFVPLNLNSSGDFLIGFSATTGAGVHPADVDATSPSAQRSYLSTDGGATFKTLDALGQPGSLAIRAVIQVPSGSTAAPSISVSASSLAFGSVPVGQSATQTVTITNRGNANLNVSKITAPAGYTVTPAAPLQPIAPGGNAVLSVTLTPTTPGSYNGAITITSDDPVNSPSIVNLTGTGVAAGGFTIGSVGTVLVSDSFKRADATACSLGASDSAFGGSPAYYLPIFPGSSGPVGANIVSNGLQNNGLNWGGVQLTAAAGACTNGGRGETLPQDLDIRVDLLVPVTAGKITAAGPYLRNRAAAAGDGIEGGTSGGYWVRVVSTGEVRVTRLDSFTLIATTGAQSSFNPAATHTLEVMAKGSSMQVKLDGVVQTFTQNGSPVTVVTLPTTGGNNDGTVGIGFSSEDNPGMAGGERANNFVVSTVNGTGVAAVQVSTSPANLTISQGGTSPLTLTNSGSASASVTLTTAAPFGLASSSAGPFAATLTTSVPLTGRGSGTVVYVSFNPPSSTTANQTGLLHIAVNGIDNGSPVPLTGTIAPAAAGSMLVTSDTSSALHNLTTEGQLDWVHYGDRSFTGPTTPQEHKLAESATGIITSQLNYNNTSIGTYTNDPRPLSWSDGNAPTLTSSGSNAGLFTQSAVGSGFALSAPSDPTTLRTLVLHVGGFFSSGQLKVSLSDNSASPVTLTTPNTGGQWDRNFFITYQGASAGATVNIVWTLASGDNVTLNGAALSPSN